MYKVEPSPLSGICIDHYELDISMLTQVLEFAINGSEAQVLCLDRTKMPLQLIKAITPFTIADNPVIDRNSYQDVPRKKSRRFPEQSPPHSGFPPINNPLSIHLSDQSPFHPPVPAFQPTSHATFQAGSSNQYTNSIADLRGVMETFYEALWGNSWAFEMVKCQMKVQQPQFYIDPEYPGIAEGAQPPQFKLTGISLKVQLKGFLKIQPSKKMPPLTKSFIQREEYIRIEALLEETVSSKWANGSKREKDLDYMVSGQPGCGTYWVSYVSSSNC